MSTPGVRVSRSRRVIQQRQDGVRDRASDVLKVDVDAFRTSSRQSLGKISAAAVDSGIAAQFFDNTAALVGAAGDTDHAAILELGNLAHH